MWFLYCRWDKTRRASSDKDKPEDITRGEAYHNHGLRKVSANAVFVVCLVGYADIKLLTHALAAYAVA